MMESKIQDYHLNRLAYVYLRQSTMSQVRFNQESTLRQYALKDQAEKLGWESNNIRVLDGDLGVSGKQSNNRQDFQILVAEVSLGRVGAVFALEASRLSRSCTDWHRLLELCALTETLIIDEDGCYSPADFNDQLLLGIKGTMSQAELHFIRARLLGGKLNKAKRGELRSPLPVGYYYDDEKNIVFDDDIQVQETIQLLFKVFRDKRSAYAVIHYFSANDLKFPTRAYGGLWNGKLVWGSLNSSRVCMILKNPCYAGVYVYGRYRQQTKLNAEGELSKSITRVALDKCHTVIYDHHEGYISWNEYLDNQQILLANRTNQEDNVLPSAVREGASLLQGLLICKKCGHRFSIRYKAVGKLRTMYECHWEKNHGIVKNTCCFIYGEYLDQAISKRLLEVVEPKQLEIACKAFEEVENRCKSLEKQWQMKIQRAEYESQLAQKRYEEVDPANRLVAASLEKKWNNALLNLEEVHNGYNDYQQKNITTRTLDKDKLIALATDLPTLWHAETTSIKDKKRIVRLLIKDITVEKIADQAKAVLYIRWQGGATESLEVALPRRSSDQWRHSSEIVDRVRELALSMTDNEIAAKFTQEGLISNKGNLYTGDSISWIRFKHKIPAPGTQKPDELSINQLAEKFEVSHYVVRYWIERGVIEARRAGKKLFISITPEEEVKLKSWVANSTKIALVKLKTPKLN